MVLYHFKKKNTVRAAALSIFSSQMFIAFFTGNVTSPQNGVFCCDGFFSSEGHISDINFRSLQKIIGIVNVFVEFLSVATYPQNRQ